MPTLPEHYNDDFTFDESYVWSLTSSTNPYTGPCMIALDSSSSSLRLATQKHICHLDCSDGSFSRQQQPSLHSRSIHSALIREKIDIEDKANIHCVGYHANSSWEVLTTLLDISHSTNEGQIDETDPHRRSASSLDETLELAVNSDNNLPNETTTIPPISETTVVPEETRPRSGPIAELVLRSLSPATLVETYSTHLDFRPLTVTMAAHRSSAPGIVWLGSADHAQLHAFRHAKGETDEAPGKLIPIDLSNVAFTVTSPVMAIHCLPAAPASDASVTSGLVFACQDGTLRLLTWDMATSEDTFVFSGLQQKQVIIDGPILALQVQWSSRNSGEIEVTAGSLCGYVAVWHCDTLDPPTMVVQGLLQSHSQPTATEDSVLAVAVHTNRVFVGTQAGRCLVFVQKISGSYALRWSCQLSYPIYAITCLSDEWFFVTTRRSLHLFQTRYTTMSDISVIAYKAARVRERLTLLLEKQASRTIEAAPSDAMLPVASSHSQQDAAQSDGQLCSKMETEPSMPPEIPDSSDDH
jgi:hypothetical protein